MLPPFFHHRENFLSRTVTDKLNHGENNVNSALDTTYNLGQKPMPEAEIRDVPNTGRAVHTAGGSRIRNVLGFRSFLVIIIIFFSFFSRLSTPALAPVRGTMVPSWPLGPCPIVTRCDVYEVTEYRISLSAGSVVQHGKYKEELKPFP